MILAAEKGMFFDGQDNEQITRGATLTSRLTLTRNSQLHTVVDSSRNRNLEKLLFANPAGSLAGTTGSLNDLTRALTGSARAGDGEEALLIARLPLPAALGTGSQTIFRVGA